MACQQAAPAAPAVITWEDMEGSTPAAKAAIKAAGLGDVTPAGLARLREGGITVAVAKVLAGVGYTEPQDLQVRSEGSGVLSSSQSRRVTPTATSEHGRRLLGSADPLGQHPPAATQQGDEQRIASTIHVA